MWDWLNQTLTQFRTCFTRAAAFEWFVTTMLGLMLRSDHLGITSIVRELSLSEKSYKSLLNLFRSSAWQLLNIRRTWVQILGQNPFLFKVDGRCVLTHDGVKASKEGKKMPGVKNLRQESDNSAKGEYIRGHLFGGLSVLIGTETKLYNILVSLRLHDGISAIQKWMAPGEHYNYNNEESHVVKGILDAAEAVKTLGKSILLLDRLYLTKPMLKTLAMFPDLAVITKAKSNAVAYHYPGEYKGRGRRPRKGASVNVFSLFDTHASQFIEKTIKLYGKAETLKYFSINLLWGDGLYCPLKFVLTDINGIRTVFVSTDLTLHPELIIKLYTYRFKIECSFRELKQVIAGFSYHFWSKVMPRLERFKKNDVNQANVERIEDPHDRKLLIDTVKAIEGFAQFSAIALGILQLISLAFGAEINRSGNRFMRTVSNTVPSERTVAEYMRKNILSLFTFQPKSTIVAIMNARLRQPQEVGSDKSA